MKRLIFALVALAILGACARNGDRTIVDVSAESPPADAAQAPQSGDFIKNPRLLEAELIMKINVKEVYDSRKMVDLNRRLKLMPYEKPQLHLWCAEPTDHYNQKIQEVAYSVTPSLIYEDEENGNRVAYWNLTSRLPEPGWTDVIEIKRRIRLLRWEPDFDVDPALIGEYDKDSFLYRSYTKSEDGVELTKEIREKAAEIVGDETNPYRKAKMILEWILDNVSYKYPPEKRGAKFIFRNKEGDCGEYSYLYCALCRAAGIPARFVSGLWFGDDFGFHVWAELYFPGYGWFPVDASRADAEDGDYDWEYFGWLENTRLTTSRGNNIPLENAPEWASYGMTDVEDGVTPFMQFSTEAAFAVDYEMEREYRSIKNEALPNEKPVGDEEWTTFSPRAMKKD